MLKRLDVHEIDELGVLEALTVGKEFGSGTSIVVKSQRIPIKKVGATCDIIRRQLNGVLQADMVVCTVRHDGEIYALTLGELFNLQSE